ncbi:MAG: hypothetical protein WAL25_08230 [Acidimicrobiia bacterium]
MSHENRRDPFLEQAKEAAEGTELLSSPDRGLLLEKEREEAQGVEVFEDPDATIPGDALKESGPRDELLSGDAAGLGWEDDDDRTNTDGGS